MKHIIQFIKYLVFRRKWTAKNLHNETSAGNIFNMEHVSVGCGTYGKLNISQWGAESEALKIGSWCSIADGVKFLCGGNHSLNTISTFPFIKKYTGVNEAWSKGPIIINDDVWLGTNALILSGVEIGQGAVIAAGAVVANDIPPYAIAAGVPAKVVKYRFNQEMIDKLLQLDLGKMDKKYIQEHLGILTAPLDTQTLEKLSDLSMNK